jgi:hypothetical protein
MLRQLKIQTTGRDLHFILFSILLNGTTNISKNVSLTNAKPRGKTKIMFFSVKLVNQLLEVAVRRIGNPGIEIST